MVVTSRKLNLLYKETLFDIVLWLTFLPDSNEKVGNHNTTSRSCGFNKCEIGVTKNQSTVSHEDCDRTFLYTSVINII
jgi:hypothetical protein